MKTSQSTELFDAGELAILNRQLISFVSVDRCILTAALATADGFQIAQANSGEPAHLGRIAAMSSSLVALATAVTRELAMKSLDFVLVEAQMGRIVVGFLSILDRPPIVLSIVATRELLLGKVLADCRELGAQISSALKAGIR